MIIKATLSNKHKLSTRLLSLLLVIATLVGLLAVSASAAASLGSSVTVKITRRASATT